MRPEDLQPILRNICHLEPDRQVVVGVSGGPDSLCLLDILHKLGYRITVAHFDHQLRPESSQDAERVRQAAADRDLPFELGSQDIARLAEDKALSIEEAARIARYQFLFNVARGCKAQAVAVGHTADDQVETMLMHLLRGSGLAGLKGMRLAARMPEWDTSIMLVRPLLETWHSETLAYCAEYGLLPVFDPTNRDTTIYRNRLRHELIPYLEQYNPRIREALLRSAQALAGDYDLLTLVVDQAWQACFLEAGPGFVAFDLDELRTQQIAVQRGLMRAAIAQLRPSLRDFDFADIERALAFIAEPPVSGQADLAGNLRLRVEGSRLFLAAWEAELPGDSWLQISGVQQHLIRPEQALAIGNGWVLMSQIQAPPVGKIPQEPLEAWLDVESLQLPLTVRCRRPGDRFRPFGMGGRSVKLSDYFINVKLPQRARAAWPLVCSGDEIAWVPGYRPGEFFRLKDTTKQALHLWLSPGRSSG